MKLKLPQLEGDISLHTHHALRVIHLHPDRIHFVLPLKLADPDAHCPFPLLLASSAAAAVPPCCPHSLVKKYF